MAMNWFYVEAGQQAGPVGEEQLAQLVADGRIVPHTLVWHEGMTNWQPWAEARPPAFAAAPAAADELPPILSPTTSEQNQTVAACAECGRVQPKADMIAFRNVFVCAACKPVFMQKLAEGAQLRTGGFHYAGFWIRVGAKLLDGIILSLFAIPAYVFAFMSMASGDGSGAVVFQVLQILFQLCYMVVSVAYNIFFVGKYGATPGKMLLKLKVITADGGKVSYARATGRAFAEILSAMICYIGYIIVGFDEEKRALHDHICTTRVIVKQ